MGVRSNRDWLLGDWIIRLWDFSEKFRKMTDFDQIWQVAVIHDFWSFSPHFIGTLPKAAALWGPLYALFLTRADYHILLLVKRRDGVQVCFDLLYDLLDRDDICGQGRRWVSFVIRYTLKDKDNRSFCTVCLYRCRSDRFNRELLMILCIFITWWLLV